MRRMPLWRRRWKVWQNLSSIKLKLEIDRDPGSVSAFIEEGCRERAFPARLARYKRGGPLFEASPVHSFLSSAPRLSRLTSAPRLFLVSSALLGAQKHLIQKQLTSALCAGASPEELVPDAAFEFRIR